jgi:hypothetical protein
MLWPKGVTSYDECPNDLAMATIHATFILNSMENLMEGEEMAEWKWAFPEEVETHFERIKEARKKKFGSSDNSRDDDPPGGMVQNELARNLR